MKDIQKILSWTRRAVEKYGMIRRGDRIAVGFSGGKDSAVLLLTLCKMQKFNDFDFDLAALTIDPGFENVSSMNIKGLDISAMSDFCRDIGVEHIVVKTRIAEIVFDRKKAENPCGLCARLRRGALNDEAEKLGYNTLALAHHSDDAAETFMMNLFFQGRIGCFSPVTYYNDNFKLIRPFIYIREKEIASFARHSNLPVAEKLCPADGNTERESIKKLLNDFDIKHRGLHSRISGALERGEIDGWKI